MSKFIEEKLPFLDEMIEAFKNMPVVFGLMTVIGIFGFVLSLLGYPL